MFHSPFDQPGYGKTKKKAKKRKKAKKKAKKRAAKKAPARKKAKAARPGRVRPGLEGLAAAVSKAKRTGETSDWRAAFIIQGTTEDGARPITTKAEALRAGVEPHDVKVVLGHFHRWRARHEGKPLNSREIKVGDKLLGGKVVDVTKVGRETVVALEVPRGRKLAPSEWKSGGVVTLRGEATLSLVDMNDPRDLDFARLHGWHDEPPVLLEIPKGYSHSRSCRWATGHYWQHSAGGGHNFRPSFKFKYSRTGTVWRMDTRVRAKGSRLKKPTKVASEKQRKATAKLLGVAPSSSWKKLAGSRYPGKGFDGKGQRVLWEAMKDAWKHRIMAYLTKPDTEFKFKVGRRLVGAATLDSLSFHLTAGHVSGKAADDTAIHYALWEFVKEGVVQHTTGEPVWFVPRIRSL